MLIANFPQLLYLQWVLGTEQILLSFGAETAINKIHSTNSFVVSHMHIQYEVLLMVAQTYFAVCLENIFLLSSAC